MDENSLRWKARIGGLRSLGGVIAIFAVIFLCILLTTLPAALNNTGTPQAVQIQQLVKGEIGADKHVTVSGLALYDVGYNKTKDGKPYEDYFFLVEDGTDTAIVVKAAALIPEAKKETSEPLTFSGMTRSAPSELSKLIESDMPDFRKAGLETTSKLYLGQGQAPPNAVMTIAGILALGFITLLGVIPFLFPATVFGPHPIELTGTPASGEPGVKASGKFQRLASVRPEIKLGKGTRNFKESVANLIPLAERNLMVYIHYILTTKTYGITVNRQETDWGVFINSSNMVDIEPGKLYGWRDRWAVRLRYKDEKEKQQEVIVSFNHANAQADFVNLLRKMQFSVGMGMGGPNLA